MSSHRPAVGPAGLRNSGDSSSAGPGDAGSSGDHRAGGEDLFPGLPAVVEWGPDRVSRVRACLHDLGDPHDVWPALHVGGTNGKGTVAAAWDSVLRAAGRTVGLYTSPHLCSVTERYRIAGRPVSRPRLAAVADELREDVERHGLTSFEAATVLAFEIFRRESVGVAVVEVGLGGRLDATNVLRPRLTAVTGVALDHAEFLGDSLEEIAHEKAGIAEAGVPFVTAETDPALVEIFGAAAREAGAPFHRLDPGRDVLELKLGLEGSRFELDTGAWGRLELASALVGRHQATDVALAVRALSLLDDELRPGRDAVVEGIGRMRWPGRLQVERRQDRTWMLDVAHNGAAAEALAGALDRLPLPPPWVLVAGILADKDRRAILSPLLRRVDRAILTCPPSVPPGRRWDPEEAARELDGEGLRRGPEVVRDFATSLERGVVLSRPAGTLIVTGSHYTVAGALRALNLPPCAGSGGSTAP